MTFQFLFISPSKWFSVFYYRYIRYRWKFVVRERRLKRIQEKKLFFLLFENFIYLEIRPAFRAAICLTDISVGRGVTACAWLSEKTKKRDEEKRKRREAKREETAILFAARRYFNRHCLAGEAARRPLSPPHAFGRRLVIIFTFDTHRLVGAAPI